MIKIPDMVLDTFVPKAKPAVPALMPSIVSITTTFFSAKKIPFYAKVDSLCEEACNSILAQNVTTSLPHQRATA